MSKENLQRNVVGILLFSATALGGLVGYKLSTDVSIFIDDLYKEIFVKSVKLGDDEFWENIKKVSDSKKDIVQKRQ